MCNKEFGPTINDAFENMKIIDSCYKKLNNLPLMKLDQAGFTLLFNNLVDNAVKYSEETPMIDISLKDYGPNAVLTVADQGIGIPAHEKKKVLEKFYRIGSEETRKTKGTGLGLFIVNQIVIAHKGKIEILENKPRGTVFKIELPV